MSKILVYRCVNEQYSSSWKGVEYFAVNKSYALNFGQDRYCLKFEIDLNQAKVLDLAKYNQMYKDTTGINGNKFNRIQGIFVIGEMSIAEKYAEPLSRFAKALPAETKQFIQELKDCDAICGEDAGYENETVYAVKPSGSHIVSSLSQD